MDVVKALLVFFVLTGCAEVAGELQRTRNALGPETSSPQHEVAARLGPPNPLGSGVRHVDCATAKAASRSVD